MTDGRIECVEVELMNKVLLKKRFKSGFQKLNKEYCELCCSMFGSGKFDFSEGYCTENYIYWVCKKCYNENSVVYQWKVKEEDFSYN